MLTPSLITFIIAAGLLTLTPGLDTALILRTSTVEGPRKAALAALGITLGCLVWGASVALGLGALLAASQLAYTILKWVGAAYLCWLGINLILKPRTQFVVADNNTMDKRSLNWFWKGLLGNLLNPKIGVFYVTFLPQFIPSQVHVASYTLFLVSIHLVEGMLWAAFLIIATQPLARFLRRPTIIKAMDRMTGGVFIAFGLTLALSRR